MNSKTLMILAGFLVASHVAAAAPKHQVARYENLAAGFVGDLRGELIVDDR